MAPKKKWLLKENIKKKTKENEQPEFKKKWTKDLSRHLTRKDMQRANKHKKRCPTSYVMKEIQIKTMRYHHTPIRMAKIQLTHQMLASMWSNREGCLHCWWEWKMVQPPWKTVWQFLTKHILTYNLATVLFGTVSSQRSWQLMSTQKPAQKCVEQLYS